MLKLSLILTAAAWCAAAAAPPELPVKARIYFEPNLGQVSDPNVQFMTRGGSLRTLFTATETILASKSAKPVRMQFAAAKVLFVGEDEQPGISAYYIGNDKTKWIPRVPHYAKIRAKDVYPGIDLVYYANAENQLEYDFVVAPGADPKQIELSFQGAPVKTTSAGDLELSDGAILHKRARVHQGSVNIAADYKLQGSSVTFELADYDRNRELTIDPVIDLFQTQNGSAFDHYHGVHDDAAGNIYLAGTTASPNFPLLLPFQSHQGGDDAIAVKYSSNGTLLYSTFIGGNGQDVAYSVSVSSAGFVYVSGLSNSIGFPTVGAGSTAHDSVSDLSPFVTVLNPNNGSGPVSLFWSTSIPGGVPEISSRVFTGPGGYVHVAAQYASYTKVFRLLPGTGLVNTTTLAAGSKLLFSDLGIDAAGNAYFGGSTAATDLLTVNAYQSTKPAGAGTKGFLGKIVYSGSNATIDYLTYFGGTNPGSVDVASIAVSASGKVVAVSSANSAVPTENGTPFSASTAPIYLFALNPRGPGAVTAAYGTFPITSSGTINLTRFGLSLDSYGTVYFAGNNGSAGLLFRATPNASGVPVQSGYQGIGLSFNFSDTASNMQSTFVSADRRKVYLVGDAPGYEAILIRFNQAYNVSAQSNPAGAGLIIQFDSPLPWIEGEPHTLHAIGGVDHNGTGYTFASWNISGPALLPVNLTNAAGAPVPSYVATFTPVSYRLLTSQVGSGTITSGSLVNCSSTCQTQLPINSVVTLTANPSPGWVFTGWLGACTGTGSCNVTMNSVKQVHANFIQANATVVPNGPLVIALVAKAGDVGGLRTWSFSATNRDTVEVGRVWIDTLTLTQVGGAVCTPVILSDLQNRGESFGSLASGGINNARVLINFAGCPGNARFTVNAVARSESPVKATTLTLMNQFQ